MPLRKPPRPGEHTREVLAEAGLTAAEIDELVGDQVPGRVSG
jgi:crotonobetainyl-CoA:carnitine CoA-transferase CaiB-like acyl-CoA transferase